MTDQLDSRFWSLVEDRFNGILKAFPTYATFVGIHTEDGRFGDGTREALDQHLADEKRFLGAVEALDPAGLSEAVRFERDLAIYGAKRSIWDTEVHRVWERRSTAMDEVGDGIFAILARDFAPLPERLASIASRLEGVPRLLTEHRTRLGSSPVRTWNGLEIESAEQMPSLFDEVVASGRSALPEGSAALRRVEAAAAGAAAAVAEYAGWLREQDARATDDWALGGDLLDELVSLRAFDGLTTDEILAIGWEQLEKNQRGRRDAARRVDPGATEAEVVDRVKSNHPATFAEALDAYRRAMFGARDFIVERDLATIPPGERLEVVPTPEYMRNVIPFAAYFEPPKFDPSPSGIYIVTPSVDGEPRAMREHCFASISNTGIHEAYPGHHLQLSAALGHPSLVRILTDPPEFVEGWAMYCEQMMREEGFDTAPESLVALYTDAIWRSCRIILDVRMHRGEMTVDEATDFLVRHTSFERPQARAEILRYTYTPTYQFSYLLGKILLLRLRDDERRRLGDSFSLKRFHDALIYSGSLPISYHRRLLAGEGGGPTMPPAS
jgi:uncharacterized protein (DUF885 family)